MADRNYTGLYVVRSYTPSMVIVLVCKGNHAEQAYSLDENSWQEHDLVKSFRKQKLPILVDLTKIGFQNPPKELKS